MFLSLLYTARRGRRALRLTFLPLFYALLIYGASLVSQRGYRPQAGGVCASPYPTSASENTRHAVFAWYYRAFMGSRVPPSLRKRAYGVRTFLPCFRYSFFISVLFVDMILSFLIIGYALVYFHVLA